MENNNYENIILSATRLNAEPEVESAPVNYQNKLIEDARAGGMNLIL